MQLKKFNLRKLNLIEMELIYILICIDVKNKKRKCYLIQEVELPLLL